MRKNIFESQKPYDDSDILNPEFSPIASATDMTGLIPSDAAMAAEPGDINAYGGVYPYLGHPDDIE